MNQQCCSASAQNQQGGLLQCLTGQPTRGPVEQRRPRHSSSHKGAALPARWQYTLGAGALALLGGPLSSRRRCLDFLGPADVQRSTLMRCSSSMVPLHSRAASHPASCTGSTGP